MDQIKILIVDSAFLHLIVWTFLGLGGLMVRFCYSMYCFVRNKNKCFKKGDIQQKLLLVVLV